MQIKNALMLGYLKSFHALSQHACFNIKHALIGYLNSANRFLRRGTHADFSHWFFGQGTHAACSLDQAHTPVA